MQMEFFNDPKIILVCLILATLRIYIEIIGLDLKKLPISAKVLGTRAEAFHRNGLYLSVGYIVLFGPQALFF